MKRLYISLALVVVAALGSVRASGQTVDPTAGAVAESFTLIERQFVALTDAMPPDKYGFKPTAGEFKGVRTFGEQVKHVACANFAFYNQIEKKIPPEGCEEGGPSPATTKAELMAYLRESFAYAGRVLRTLTAANALERVERQAGRARDSGSRRSRSGTPRITTVRSSSTCA